jgi:hypothetical protein
LTAKGFFAATTWARMLSHSLTGGFRTTGFVVNAPQCGLGFYGHVLIATRFQVSVAVQM